MGCCWSLEEGSHSNWGWGVGREEFLEKTTELSFRE